jgi:hypothetical protein
VFVLNFVCRDETLQQTITDRIAGLFACVSCVDVPQEVNKVFFACKTAAFAADNSNAAQTSSKTESPNAASGKAATAFKTESPNAASGKAESPAPSPANLKASDSDAASQPDLTSGDGSKLVSDGCGSSREADSAAHKRTVEQIKEVAKELNKKMKAVSAKTEVDLSETFADLKVLSLKC